MTLIKRFVLTYNKLDGHPFPSHEELMKALNSFCSEVVFQLERGEKEHRLHYQGRFETTKRTSASAARTRLKEKLELKDLTPLTVKREKSENSQDYCVKTETRVEGPWYGGTSAYVSEQSYEELPKAAWCKKVMTFLDSPIGDMWKFRKVLVFYDRLGGNSKSKFVRYLSRNPKYNFHKIPVDNPDRARHGVCKWVKAQEVDGFSFNLQRTRGRDSDMDSMFELIEDIKDAHITSFFGGHVEEVVFSYPWVMIFTNEDPRKFKDKLSQDRWVPFEVYKEELFEYNLNPLGSFDTTNYGSPIDPEAKIKEFKINSGIEGKLNE